MAWRLANSLVVYTNQINFVAPHRSKASDGSIGDAAHQGTPSDHNPQVIAGLGLVPVVTAKDITHDPANGCDFNVIAESIRASRDPRVKYMIWNRRIMRGYTVSGIPAWTWRPYSGDNPHDKHGHLSVVADGRADQTHDWSIPMDLMTDGNFRTMAIRVEGLLKNQETVTVDWGSGPVVEHNEVHATLKAIRTELTALRAVVEALSTGTGHTIQEIEDASYRANERSEDS